MLTEETHKRTPLQYSGLRVSQKSARPVLFLSGALYVRGSAKKKKKESEWFSERVSARAAPKRQLPHSVLVLVASVLAVAWAAVNGWLVGLLSPPLPVDHPSLLQKHPFHVLREDHPHVHRHLSLKKHGVPLSPLDAEHTGLAHDGSFKSPHLFSSLYFKDLLHARTLLPSPSVHRHPLRPKERHRGG